MKVVANEKAKAEKILQIKHASIRPLKLLRDSVLVFSVNVPGTTSKDVMDVVLVTLDTMKEVGALSSHTNQEL